MAIILISCLLHGERKQTGEGDGDMKFCFLSLHTDKEGIYYKKEKSPACFWRIQTGGRMRRSINSGTGVVTGGR